jgi:cytochrome P450
MDGKRAEFGSPEMLEDPFSFYEARRDEAPLLPVPSRNIHVVTRREDIEYVALHPELFSNKGRASLVSYPGQRYKTMPDLTSTDAPEHKAIREAHLSLLSAKRLREMRPALEEEANRLIDQFVGKSEIEFIQAFAKPFPAWVMGHLLCVPREMHAQLDVWAVNYFELFDKNLHHASEGGPDPRLITSFVDFMNYCGDLAVDRREHPTDDPLSEFVNAKKPDGSLYSIDEMANYIRLLVVGAQTSTYLIAQSLIDVLRMDDRGDLNDRVHVQKILDESLRKDGPATYGPRICTKDVEIAGTPLPAGSRVFLAWQSGNRDEKTFECPAEFRPDRSKLAKHLGFGLGNHRCIGAPLAQIEGEVALKAMFHRFREIRLSPKNDYRHDTSLTSMRALKELHLELEAAP